MIRPIVAPLLRSHMDRVLYQRSQHYQTHSGQIFFCAALLKHSVSVLCAFLFDDVDRRALVEGLRHNTAAENVDSNMLALWARAVSKNRRLIEKWEKDSED